MDNILKRALEKISFPGMDIDFYMERVSTFPKNEWFMPNNSENNDYSICAHLFEMYLIERKTTPIWFNGSFRGLDHTFRINEDLKYNGKRE